MTTLSGKQQSTNKLPRTQQHVQLTPPALPASGGHSSWVSLPVKEPGTTAFSARRRLPRDSSCASSSLASHSAAGGAPTNAIGSLWPRHRKDSSSDSNRSRGVTHGNGSMERPRAKIGAPSVTRQYEFEWQEPSFFKPNVSQPLLEADSNGQTDNSPDVHSVIASPTDTLLCNGNAGTGSGGNTNAGQRLKFGTSALSTPTAGPASADGEQPAPAEKGSAEEDLREARDETTATRERGNTRDANGLRVWSLNLRLEKFVLMEVAWGTHQLVEMSAAEVIKRVRMHGMVPGLNSEQAAAAAAGLYSAARNFSMDKMSTLMKRKPMVGEITYRDIRQVFSEAQRTPSLEIRRNCIILCLPPLTALVFHDRCVFLVNEDIDVDSLILRLEDITGTYSSKAEETERFFLESTDDGGAIFDSMTPAVAEEPQSYVAGPSSGATTRSIGKGMLLSAENTILRPRGLMAPEGSPAQSQACDDGASSTAPRFVLFPLEFAILEILISCAFEAIDADLEALEQRQDRVKERVKQERQPRDDRLEELHEIKAPVESFADKMGSLSKAFKVLLSSPEDMMYMELTKLYYKPHLYHKRLNNSNAVVNPNLEILLEFFDQEVEQFERRAHMVLRNVENAERYINLKMALTRNQLVYWDLTSTILTVGLGGGACIGGVFGMNIHSGIEESPWLFHFFTATIVMSCASGLVAIAILRHKYG